jgi:hypothetical protein
VTVGTNAFGALKSGAVSQYRTVGAVYEHSSVFTLETNLWQRNDRFMGGANGELSPGKYLYTLTLATNGMLKVNLHEER